MTGTDRRRVLLAALAVGVAALAMGSLAVGEFPVTPQVLVRALAHGVSGGSLESPAERIVWDSRLPTAVIALLAGASLATAGLMMQTYFRNPLAGPDVMGVSAGASLGVALATLAKGSGLLLPTSLFSQFGTIAAASAGALVVILLALFAARWYDDALTLLVLGLMFAALAMGIVGLLAVFAHSDRLYEYVRWSFGSFDGAWQKVPAFAGAAAAGVAAALALVKPLNVLQIGPEYAEALGVRLPRARAQILAAAAVLTGATTAVCGPIAFLGIAAPVLAKAAFRTSDHRWLLPGSVLIGAGLALSVDLAAKTLARPAMLPVNSISGVLGAPLVMWVVLRWRPRR